MSGIAPAVGMQIFNPGAIYVFPHVTNLYIYFTKPSELIRIGINGVFFGILPIFAEFYTQKRVFCK